MRQSGVVATCLQDPEPGDEVMRYTMEVDGRDASEIEDVLW